MPESVNNSNVFFAGISPDLPIDRTPRNQNKTFIPFGKENLFPQQAAKLSRESVNHRSILNSKTTYCEGKEFQSEDKRLLQFLEDNNFKDKVFHNALFDFFMDGNGYIEFVKDSKGNLLKVFHQDTTKCRKSSNKDVILIHPDWKDYKGVKDERTKEVAIYPNYSKGDDGMLHSIYHIFDYEPEFTHYGVPSWFAGLRSANISKKTNEYNDERLDNKFSVDGMIFIPGIASIEDAQKIDLKLNKYQGSKNGGKILPHYTKPLGTGETREKPEFIPFNQTADGLFMELHKQSNADMIMIHSWYRSLAAFEENTGFDTQRILNDYKMALASVISVVQGKFLAVFNEVFSAFGFGDDLSIFNMAPVYIPDSVEYVWEVRKRKGLDYDNTGKDPKQMLFYAELTKGSVINIGGDNG